MKNEQLFLDYRFFAKKLAYEWWHENGDKNWVRHSMDVDDCISEALIYLYKAADSFDEMRGIKFSVYAAMFIHRRFNDIRRKWGVEEIVCFFSEFLPYSDTDNVDIDNTSPYESIIGDNDEVFSDIEDIETFRQFYSFCRERDQKIMRLLLAEAGVYECARQLNISQPAVSLRRKKLLQQYREFAAC